MDPLFHILGCNNVKEGAQHLSIKDTSILSTEEDEMASFTLFESHFARVGEMTLSGRNGSR